MFFKKRIELSARTAGQAAMVLMVVANYLKDHDQDTALSLMVVAGQLLPGKTVRVGKIIPTKTPMSAGLEPLIDLLKKPADR